MWSEIRLWGVVVCRGYVDTWVIQNVVVCCGILSAQGLLGWDFRSPYHQRSWLSGEGHVAVGRSLPSKNCCGGCCLGKSQQPVGKLVCRCQEVCLGAWLPFVGKGHRKYGETVFCLREDWEGWPLEEDHTHASWKHNWIQHSGDFHGSSCVSQSWDWERHPHHGGAGRAGQTMDFNWVFTLPVEDPHMFIQEFCAPLQFIAARKPSSGPPQGMIAWADLTKFGRMDHKQLNFAVSVLDKVLSKNPTTSVGIVLAPHLISEKVNGGLRGEIRLLGLGLV